MAVTAREVIMIFRGQNYLSGAIRRVSTDVAGLSRRQQSQLMVGAAAAAQNRAALANKAAQAELRSVQIGGSRYLAAQDRIASKQQAIATTRQNMAKNETTLHGRNIALTAQQGRLEAANAARAQLITNRWQSRAKLRAAELTGTGKEWEAANKEYAKYTQYYKQTLPLTKQQIAHEKELTELRAEQVNDTKNYSRALNGQMALQQRGLAQAKVSQKELSEIEKIKALRAKETARALAMQNIAYAQAQALAKTRVLQGFQQGARWVEHATRVLQMFSLIAAASYGYAAQAAAKFKQEATLAATQARPPGEPIARTAQIGADVANRTLGLMRQFPAAAADMNQSWYEIFSGTNIQNTKKASELMKVFNQMAVAGSADLQTVTDAGLTMYNVFGSEFPNMTEAANAFFATVRYGRGNVDQFARALPFVASIAKEVGNSFYDVGQALAFVSRQTGGRYLTRDAQGLARLYQLLARPTVMEGLKQQGIAVADASGKLRPLLDIMGDIHDKLKPTGVAAINFFKTISAGAGGAGTTGTIQAQRVFAFMMNNMEQYRKVSGLVKTDNNEMTRSFQAMNKTLGVRWGVFLNQLRAVILEVGDAAIPAFQKFGKIITYIIHWFESLSPHWKHMIGYMGAMIALGTLLGATLLSLVAGFAALAAGTVIWARLRLAMRAAWLENAAVLEGNAAVIASNRGLLASEAGFISMNRALMLGVTGVALAAIFYHKQINQAINSTTGWKNAVMLLMGAFAIANMQRIVQGFVAMNLAMKGMPAIAVLVALVAVMKNFAGAAEGARKILDFLFSSWAGYIVTTLAAATAVKQLTRALIELGIVTKAQALWSSLTGIAASVAGIPASMRTVRNLRAGMTTSGLFAMSTTGRMGLVERNAAGEATGYVRSGAGRYIGKIAAPMGEAAVATTGFGAAVRGLGGAVASFLPMLAVGGALMGGLYLWKRHLDSVHAAQEKVRATQRYLTAELRDDSIVTQFRKYAGFLENVEKAQMDYNAALKAYDRAKAEGTKGADLRKYYLDIVDAQNQLDAALTRSKSSLNAWNRLSASQEKKAGLKDRVQINIDRLQQWIKTFKSLDSFSKLKIEKGQPSGQGAWFDWITKLFDIKNMGDAQRMLKNYEKHLATYAKEYGAANRKYYYAIVNSLKEMAALKYVPNASQTAIETASKYIQTLQKAPKMDEIKLILRASVILDPGSLARVPRQYRNAVQHIQRLIYMTHHTPTVAQLRFLIRVVLGIDPKSNIGIQLQAILASVIEQIQSGGVAGFAGKQAFNIIQIAAVAAAAANDKISKDAKAKAKQRGSITAQPSLEYKMWNSIQEIVKLHQRAITTGSMKDWVAYYAKLRTATKGFTDDQVSAFNAMLDAQENALNNSAENTKVTFQDVLSGIKSMYDNFLSQEQNIFGQLGQGPLMTSPAQQFRLQWGGKATGMDYLNDLKKQMSSFAGFHAQLNRLSARGAPSALITQIMSMGSEEGGNLMKALKQLTPQQLRDYFATYNRSQKIIEEQTKKDLKRQLDIYRTHGQNIAKAIIAGIQDENVALTNWMKHLINTIFPGLPTGTTAPPKPPKDIPKPPKDIPKPPLPKPPVKTSTSTGTTSSKSEYNHREEHSYYITTTGDPISVKNQIRHAELARKNRYTGRGPGPR